MRICYGVLQDRVVIYTLTCIGGQADPIESYLDNFICSPASSGYAGTPVRFYVPQFMDLTSPDDCGVELSLLVSRLSDIIQRNLSATTLASIKHALALVNVHKMSSQPLFSDAELKQIKQSKNIYELMEKCRKHWSWGNYALLKLIVKKSGSEEAKRELQIFQKVVSVRQMVKKLGNEELQAVKECTAEAYENMMIILNAYYDDITVYQLEETEMFLSKMVLLGLPFLEIKEVKVTPITRIVNTVNYSRK